jgi:zinc protease
MKIFTTLLLLLASFLATAQVALPAGVTRVTSVEGITEYSLPNGLRILFAPDASKPTTTVNITYQVGSRHENYGETGMAHLLEHLIFFGTPSFPDARTERSRRGMRANGSTSADRTNYFASWAANDENLDWFLRWSADAMRNSFIAKKDLDTEMTVVRNEMERGENEPVRILMQRVAAVAFDWHNYGKSTIGARADLENVPIERLQGFYRAWYRPDNAVLIVSGKFDEAKTLALIAREFGKVARPATPMPATYTLDPEQQGERLVTVRRVGEVQLAIAAYHVPPGPHPDFAAVQMLARIMSDPASGRLRKALVQEGKASNVFALTIPTREPGLAIFGAQVPQTASLDNARATLVSVLEEAAKEPFTEAEVDRARTAYLRDFELNATDPERIGVALSATIAQGDWRLFFLQRDRVRSAKAADVQRVADAYLLPDNRTLGLFIPTAAPKRPPAPALVDVAPMFKDYRGDAAVAAGEAFDANHANIEARTQRTRLAGGMRVALLEKRTRGAAVNLRMVMHYGDEKSLAGTMPTGELTAQMLARGAGGLSRIQISEAFDRLKARVSFSGGSTALTVSVETTRDNLPEVMKLVAKILRSPDFPATELAELKTQRLTAIDADRRDPDDLARLALQRQGNPHPKGHVRYTATFDEQAEDVRAIGVDRLRAFHRDFYGAQDAQLAAVGDFDAAALRAQLQELFGDWKAAKPYARVANPLYPVAPTEIRIETPDKANAYFGAAVRFPMRDDAPDYPALLVANRIAGGGTDSVIFRRLRTKEGLSYGANSGLNVGPHDAHGAWIVGAIYAPQNVKRLEAAFQEEMARLSTTGFTEEELKHGKNGLLQSRRLSLAQDRELVQTLTGQLEVGRTMEYTAGIDRAIEAVTLEQANAAFRKYVDPSRLVRVYAGDFAKAAK